MLLGPCDTRSTEYYAQWPLCTTFYGLGENAELKTLRMYTQMLMFDTGKVGSY